MDFLLSLFAVLLGAMIILVGCICFYAIYQMIRAILNDSDDIDNNKCKHPNSVSRYKKEREFEKPAIIDSMYSLYGKQSKEDLAKEWNEWVEADKASKKRKDLL